jgi:7-carboxy-7-deazaguanine synthase
VFVRLTGCPLRCSWCDTTYSFTGGEAATIASVLAEVAKYPARQVCVTGGEPLAQKECLPLLTALCDAGYDVSLETSGRWILPRSTRGWRGSWTSRHRIPAKSAKKPWENLPLLNARDEIKIVIASRGDYEWARDALREQPSGPAVRCCFRRPKA